MFLLEHGWSGFLSSYLGLTHLLTLEDLSDRQRSLEACVISLPLSWAGITSSPAWEVCFVSLWLSLRALGALGKETGHQWVMGAYYGCLHGQRAWKLAKGSLLFCKEHVCTENQAKIYQNRHAYLFSPTPELNSSGNLHLACWLLCQSWRASSMPFGSGHRPHRHKTRGVNEKE